MTRVSHAHHDVLMGYANQLNDLAECLNGDCLDTAGVTAVMPRLRDLHRALRTRLIPHMDTVRRPSTRRSSVSLSIDR